MTTTLPTRRTPAQLALIVAALLLPGLFALHLALSAGSLSVRDYWTIMGRVYSVDGFSPHLADWFAAQNGHIVFIPRLIYTLNMAVTQGSNVGLTVTAWLLALAQAALLTAVIPAQIRDFRVRLLTIAAISIFSFAPSATDNWMHGFSGVHWILANLLCIGAFLCLTRYFQHGYPGWIAGSLLLLGLGTVSYGTALGGWLALVAAFGFMRARLRMGLVMGGITILVFVLVLSSRSPGPPSSVALFDRVLVFLPYLAVFFGGAFTLNLPLAFAIGATGLAFAAIVVAQSVSHREYSVRLPLLPWLLVLTYSLINAAFIALTRLEFGLGYATTQRYVTISGLFWLSLLVLLAWHLYSAKTTCRWPAVAPYGLLVLALAMLPVGIERAQRWRHQISLQPLAVLSLQLGVPDPRAIQVAITGDFYALINQAPALRADGLVPFHQVDAGRCGQPGNAAPVETAPTTAIPGEFEFIDPVAENGIRAVGWVEADPAAVECILLVNQAGIIRGRALPNFDRPDLTAGRQTGWIGYARPGSIDEPLAAYVKLSGAPLSRLEGQWSMQNPGSIRPEVYVSIVGNLHDSYQGLDTLNHALQALGYTPPPADLQSEADQ